MIDITNDDFLRILSGVLKRAPIIGTELLLLGIQDAIGDGIDARLMPEEFCDAIEASIGSRLWELSDYELLRDVDCEILIAKERLAALESSRKEIFDAP